MLTITGFKRPSYKTGSTTVDGLTVEAVCGSSEHYIVYLTKEHGLGLQYSQEVGAAAHEAIVQATDVQAFINERCPSGSQREFTQQLAVILSNSLGQAANEQAIGMQGFQRLKESVRAARTARARRSYVANAALSWAIASVLGVIALKIILATGLNLGYIPSLIKGAACGAGGALLSVLIGSAKFQLSDDLTTENMNNYQGTLRIMAGCLGGALAIAAIDSNQFFPWAKGNAPAYTFVCAAAGFVERMVPQLMAQTVEDKST
jgi:hypothetical protein